MNKIYTIGFTKKDAKTFFQLLKENEISLLIDVRLNNVSQLAAFSRYPDIVYFLKEICKCEYKPDKMFSPTDITLKEYKNNNITWDEYVYQFNRTMEQRNIDDYIIKYYSEFVKNKIICFLCSENTPENCHRRLVAERFANIFKDIEIVHLY